MLLYKMSGSSLLISIECSITWWLSLLCPPYISVTGVQTLDHCDAMSAVTLSYDGTLVMEFYS